MRPTVHTHTVRSELFGNKSLTVQHDMPHIVLRYTRRIYVVAVCAEEIALFITECLFTIATGR